MKKNIVVIGGGIAGLATAALLGKDGHKVTLLEKNQTLGGRARVFKEKGFTFDMGPSWYLMPDVFEWFFAKFGKKPSDLMDLRRLNPQYAVFFENGEKVTITKDIAENIEIFDSLEKGSKPSLQKYFDLTKFIYQIAADRKSGFVYKYFGRLLDFFDFRLLKLFAKVYLFESFGGLVRKYTKSEKIFKILGYPTVFLGGSPENIPAFYTMMSHVDFDLGVWYPMGGIGKLIDSLVALTKNYNVEYVTNAEVIKVEKDKVGKIKSVITKNGEYEADIFVNTADLHHFETDILEKEDQTYDEKYFEKLTMAPATLLLYIGVSKKLPKLEHHNLVLSKTWQEHFDEIFKDPKWPTKPSYYICAPSKTDNSVAPDNCENLFILVPIAPGLDDSVEESNKLANWVIDDIEKAIGEKFAQNIVYKKIFSIKDMKADYNAYKGTAFAPSQTLWQTAYFRPHNKSKRLNNLYYAGHYTQPGIGMPMVLISADFVADKISQDIAKISMNKNQIFKKGSTTYYFSSIFFPKDVREKVFTLYAFVRTADDYADHVPQDKQGFYDFKSKTLSALEGKISNNLIIDDYAKLAREKNFERAWTESFLGSMESDLTVKKYESFTDLEKYIYGSANVIGLMMARIMDLPEKSFEAAQKLGKSMQFINFIRDIKEDLELGRVYMPQDELKKFGLSHDLSNAKENEAQFAKFIRYQIAKYHSIAKEAERGFAYIPPRLRASIMTANDMYKWTANKIFQNPKVVLERKVKPSPLYVVARYLLNYIKTLFVFN